MCHAGPSITITSLTNCLAFAFGGINSLTALRSFCVFAAVCILMLYLIVMTVFLCVVVWDTERVGRQRGECCGLFMCKLRSIICCRGFFLSSKQIRFGDGTTSETVEETSKGEESAPQSEEVISSKTEKCIDKYLAPAALSNIGRVIILVVYVILIAGAIFGATQVKIDFKVTYFIGEYTQVYGWF